MSKSSRVPRPFHFRSTKSTTEVMEPPVIRVYIVRHGETNENRRGIIQGQLDTQLNEGGIQQARLCAERLKDIDFVAAFTSDLQRAVKTAEIILEKHPNVQLIKDKGLRERDMGALQGVRAGSYDKNKMPPNVEGGETFTRRALEWWEDAIARHLPELPTTSSPYNIVVVSHGAYVATLVRALCAAKIIRLQPGVGFGSVFNTSVTIIDMRRNKHGSLVKYADISHLVAPAVAHNADEQPRG